jgi:hypothetical protein
MMRSRCENYCRLTMFTMVFAGIAAAHSFGQQVPGPGCPDAHGNEFYQCCIPAWLDKWKGSIHCGSECDLEVIPGIGTFCSGNCDDCLGQVQPAPLAGRCGSAPEDGESFCNLHEKTFLLYMVVDADCRSAIWMTSEGEHFAVCVCELLTDEETGGASYPYSTCNCNGLACATPD